MFMRRHVRRGRRPRWLRIEALEDRRMLATFTVTNLNDAGPGSLRQAILAANLMPDEDTIEFDNVIGTIELSTGEMQITAPVAIHGPGQALLTIDANQQSRIFHVDDGDNGQVDVTISGLTMTGGMSTASGGAIFSRENLLVTDSTVSGNHSGGSGGGIHNDSGTATVTRSTISSNYAYGFGGGIYNNLGTATVTSSLISDNYGTIGGGVYSYGTATISDSTVSGNSAVIGGGTWNNGGGTQTITDSTISGNYAFFGGGIYNNVGTVTVTGSTISGNYALIGGGGVYNYGTATITSSTISGNSAGVKGGGIYNGGAVNNYGTVTVTGSTISGNSAGEMGGGLYNGGMNYISNFGTAIVTGSTISGNYAGGSGGGIFNGGGIYHAGTATITGSTISGNYAYSDGGGIYNYYYGVAAVTGTIVAGNRNVNGDPSDIEGTTDVDSISAHNLIGDVATSGGLADGTNGNIVGVEWRLVLQNDGAHPMLTDNGGPTQTIALREGSPAIDAGDPSFVPPPNFDQRGVPFSRVSGGVIDIGAWEFINGDFNADGDYTCADVDALVAAMVAGTHEPDYDLNSDQLVNREDLDTWLALAGVANLPAPSPFLRGDGNLDGVVDGQDFIVWDGHKFTTTAAWCSGDFNADGVVDGQDFIEWNNNKFQSSSGAIQILLPKTLREPMPDGYDAPRSSERRHAVRCNQCGCAAAAAGRKTGRCRIRHEASRQRSNR